MLRSECLFALRATESSGWRGLWHTSCPRLPVKRMPTAPGIPSPAPKRTGLAFILPIFWTYIARSWHPAAASSRIRWFSYRRPQKKAIL
jgi:hypothetical protein